MEAMELVMVRLVATTAPLVAKAIVLLEVAVVTKWWEGTAPARPVRLLVVWQLAEMVVRKV